MARRHTPEQVMAKVRRGQKMLNNGHLLIEVVLGRNRSALRKKKPA